MIKQFYGHFKVINNFIVPLEIILYIDDNRLHYFTNLNMNQQHVLQKLCNQK